MDPKSIAEQALFEHRTLQQIRTALGVAIEWHVVEAEFPRKLSSVRFMAQSFERHLKRLMTIEEEGGYMDVVAALQPNLSRSIDELRREHEEFRSVLGQVMPRLERSTPADRAAFAEVCDQLARLMQLLDEHSRKEIALLQESFLRDEGGEG